MSKSSEKPAIERLIELLSQRSKNLRRYKSNPFMQSRANEAELILRQAEEYYNEDQIKIENGKGEIEGTSDTRIEES